ncbi:MAG: cobalamin-binding protein [Gammaproteobacteria bacterium]|jgi:iron complex transport system substrate-binding protein|nr:cobalamin-binding protein [Gammaproteobacteria bacterium]|tara:strand:+ start:527 stop:1483 length:957 start_codon:yes stop_codon:yes gene_type:complete
MIGVSKTKASPGGILASFRLFDGKRKLLLCCLLSFAAVGYSHVQIEVQDDMGNTVQLPAPAQRIVSLAPHITETLYAAGAGDKIVATTQFSDFPPQANTIPIIGTNKDISYESLLSLNPDLVIAWASGNGDEIVSRIKSLGLTVFLDEPREIQDIATSLSRFGQLAGTEDIAMREAQSFMRKLNQLRNNYSIDETLSVFYQVWHEPLTTLNGEHLISDIIRLCGGINIFEELIPLAPVVSMESVLTADPQVIVVGGIDEARPDWLDGWQDWPGLSAVDNRQLHFIPPDLLQRNSPRVIQGAEQMCDILVSARAHYSLN